MTVTQYIGAPYIPHGWTTWQPATAYDGMSVVEYNLVWYIAKQPVPIGTAPTGQSNDPYWAAVDRWNGQVEEYRKEVEKVSNRLDSFYPRPLRNALFIGNSYLQKMESNLNENFDSAYYYSNGGAGWVNYTGHNFNFLTLLEGAINSGNFDLDTITEIYFIGAWGDTAACISSQSSYITNAQSNMAQATTLIHTNLKNCKRIGYAFAEFRAVNNINTSEGMSQYSDPFFVHNIIKTLCGLNGNIEYLGWIGWNLMKISRFAESDNYHPSILGSKVLTAQFMDSLNGCLTYQIRHDKFTVPFDLWPGAIITGKTEISPDNYNISLNIINRTNITSQDSINQYQEFELDLSSLNYPVPTRFGNDMISYPGLIIPNDVTNSTSGTIYCNVLPRANNNGVQLGIIPFNQVTGSPKTNTNAFYQAHTEVGDNSL